MIRHTLSTIDRTRNTRLIDQFKKQNSTHNQSDPRGNTFPQAGRQQGKVKKPDFQQASNLQTDHPDKHFAADRYSVFATAASHPFSSFTTGSTDVPPERRGSLSYNRCLRKMISFP